MAKIDLQFGHYLFFDNIIYDYSHNAMTYYDFKSKPNCDLFNTLALKGGSSYIFSTCISYLNPHFTNSDIYVYATRKDVLFVLIDTLNDNNLEVAQDVTGDSDEPPMYLSQGCKQRVSPIWQLLQATANFCQCVEEAGLEVPRLRLAVLTTSRVTPTYETMRLWEQNNVRVVRNIDTNRLPLPVNDNWYLPAAQYLKAFFKNGELSQRSLSSVNRYAPDDSEQLADLNFFTEYITREMEVEMMADLFEALGFPPDTPKEQPSAGSEEDEERWEIFRKMAEGNFDLGSPDDSEDSDYSENSEYSEDSDDSDDDPDLPDGELELTPTNTIHVEILKPMKHPQAELNKLVGCQDIRRHIDELLQLSRYNKLMQAINPRAKQHSLSLHGIFTGRPGTGKTTVCKIYGSLLRAAGVLSKGHVVVAGRGVFVGCNWGDEERLVREIVAMAQGGVLMIDEAYLLNSDHKSDPGKLVIPLLMDILANEQQRDIAIILCGYKDKMEQLLELNPGLQSRFPNKFDFPDFTIDELLEITRRRVGEYNYRFTRAAWGKYRSMITDAYTLRNQQTWGNARFVANQLERIYLQHARRCVKSMHIDASHLLTITPADIQPIEVPKAKPHIGF